MAGVEAKDGLPVDADVYSGMETRYSLCLVQFGSLGTGPPATRFPLPFPLPLLPSA